MASPRSRTDGLAAAVGCFTATLLAALAIAGNWWALHAWSTMDTYAAIVGGLLLAAGITIMAVLNKDVRPAGLKFWRPRHDDEDDQEPDDEDDEDPEPAPTRRAWTADPAQSAVTPARRAVEPIRTVAPPVRRAVEAPRTVDTPPAAPERKEHVAPPVRRRTVTRHPR